CGAILQMPYGRRLTSFWRGVDPRNGKRIKANEKPPSERNLRSQRMELGENAHVPSIVKGGVKHQNGWPHTHRAPQKPVVEQLYTEPHVEHPWVSSLLEIDGNPNITFHYRENTPLPARATSEPVAAT